MGTARLAAFRPENVSSLSRLPAQVDAGWKPPYFIVCRRIAKAGLLIQLPGQWRFATLFHRNFLLHFIAAARRSHCPLPWL
jgi:hypothetical protein